MKTMSTLIVAAALTLATSAAFAENVTVGATTNGGGASPGSSAITTGSAGSWQPFGSYDSGVRVQSRRLSRAQAHAAEKVQDGTERR